MRSTTKSGALQEEHLASKTIASLVSGMLQTSTRFVPGQDRRLLLNSQLLLRFEDISCFSFERRAVWTSMRFSGMSVCLSDAGQEIFLYTQLLFSRTEIESRCCEIEARITKRKTWMIRYRWSLYNCERFHQVCEDCESFVTTQAAIIERLHIFLESCFVLRENSTIWTWVSTQMLQRSKLLSEPMSIVAAVMLLCTR